MKNVKKLNMGVRSITLTDDEPKLQFRAMRLSINPKLSQISCASELGNHNSPTAVQKFSYFLTCKRCNSDALQQYRFLHGSFKNAWSAIP